MIYSQSHVRIFSLVSKNKKLFFVCDEDDESAESAIERYAKKLGHGLVVCGFGQMFTHDESVRFMHPHEHGIKCESEDMLWDFFDGSVPESVYVHSGKTEEYSNESLWKHYNTPHEAKISDTLDSVKYMDSGKYVNIESALL